MLSACKAFIGTSSGSARLHRNLLRRLMVLYKPIRAFLGDVWNLTWGICALYETHPAPGDLCKIIFGSFRFLQEPIRPLLGFLKNLYGPFGVLYFLHRCLCGGIKAEWGSLCFYRSLFGPIWIWWGSILGLSVFIKAYSVYVG